MKIFYDFMFMSDKYIEPVTCMDRQYLWHPSECVNLTFAYGLMVRLFIYS